MVGEVWRISLRLGNGTEVVMKTQGVGTRTPPSYSHPSKKADMWRDCTEHPSYPRHQGPHAQG